MALVVLSVVEQRLDAVRAVLSGESVVEVAARYEVARSTPHRWVGRYLAARWPGECLGQRASTSATSGIRSM